MYQLNIFFFKNSKYSFYGFLEHFAIFSIIILFKTKERIYYNNKSKYYILRMIIHEKIIESNYLNFCENRIASIYRTYETRENGKQIQWYEGARKRPSGFGSSRGHLLRSVPTLPPSPFPAFGPVFIGPFLASTFIDTGSSYCRFILYSPRTLERL